jgi:flagellar assembly protein FliH
MQSIEVPQLRAEVASLRAELEAVRADAHQRIQEAQTAGRREGDAAARTSLEPQLQSEINKLRDMMRDVLTAGTKLRRQTEEDLVRLAVAVARRILHREVTVDADALIGLVKAAFDRLDQREIMQVRTSAESLDLVKKIVETIGVPKTAKVVADPSLKRGSLIIETTRGELDASVEAQLMEIQRGFTDIVQHA